MGKTLIISTSLRTESNSEVLAQACEKGARETGKDVELISLKGKEIRFCIGCLSCQKTQKCVMKDDAIQIATKVKEAETLVFVTPIYYYEMSGQMKTLLDRLNPLFPSDYKFRRVYMLSVAAEDELYVPEKAVSGLQGWVDCFEKAELIDTLFCGGITGAGEAEQHQAKLKEAYEFGKRLA